MDAQVQKTRIFHWMARILVLTCVCNVVFAHAQGNVSLLPDKTQGSFEFSGRMMYYPLNPVWYPTLQAACEGHAAYLASIRSDFAGAYCVKSYVVPANYSGYWFMSIAFPNWRLWSGELAVVTEPSVNVRVACPSGYGGGSFEWDITTSPRSMVAVCGRSAFCPANATGKPANYPTICTCIDGYTPDSAGTSCVPVDQCPVTKLNNPPFTDACSTSLEEGKGVDVNNKCGELSDDMQKVAACIKKKIEALSTPPITYNGPSATIRTAEYQNHLLEIWSKSVQLDTIMNSLVYTAETKQACAQRKAEVDGELQKHAIDSPPSSSESKAPHVERRAIDIPRRVAKALIKQVTLYTTTYTTVNGKQIPTRTITSDVEDYIHSATVNPPACDSKINWGGRFKPVDRVHFQLPK